MAGSRLREYFRSEYQPGERLLVQKIDFFILTFCCMSYFMNYVSISTPFSPRLWVPLPSASESGTHC